MLILGMAKVFCASSGVNAGREGQNAQADNELSNTTANVWRRSTRRRQLKLARETADALRPPSGLVKRIACTDVLPCTLCEGGTCSHIDLAIMSDTITGDHIGTKHSISVTQMFAASRLTSPPPK
jgi:hypothetical protein